MAPETGGRSVGRASGPLHLVEASGIEQLIDIEDDEQVVGRAGEALDEAPAADEHRIVRRLDLVRGDAHHAGDRVHEAPHHPLADVHHDRAGLGVDRPAFESEEDAQVDDRDDRAPEVADAVDARRHLRQARDARGDHDFADAFDPKDVVLTREPEPDELRGAGGTGGGGGGRVGEGSHADGRLAMLSRSEGVVGRCPERGPDPATAHRWTGWRVELPRDDVSESGRPRSHIP